MDNPITLEQLTSMGLDLEKATLIMDHIHATQQAAAQQSQRADALQAQLETMQAELEAAQAREATFSELQTRLAEAEAQLQEAALREAIALHNPVDINLILRLLDRSALHFSDGGLDGLEDQIKALKHTVPCLFKDAADNYGGRADSGFAGSAFDMNAFLRGEK